jgi:hypothetical protein
MPKKKKQFHLGEGVEGRTTFHAMIGIKLMPKIIISKSFSGGGVRREINSFDFLASYAF